MERATCGRLALMGSFTTHRETNIEDATTLLKALGPRFSDPEGVWDVVGGFVPERERDKARESLHTLWEHLHEPA